MASIKVKFRPSSIANCEGAIYYQIIHERKARQLATNYKIFPAEWDEKRSTLATRNADRRSFILAIRERIRWDIELLTKIAHNLDDVGFDYTADDVIEEFNRYAHEYSLFNYMESMIIKLKHNGKTRTSETYKATLNSFKKFRNGEDIILDAITSETMEAYEAWHRNRGVAPNSISFYTRILRAVYNRAVEDDTIENRNPFRHVYTGIDKTVKRALPLPTIKKIKSLDLILTPALDFTRDMFMMSFYLRGMSFIDMAFLKKTDLRNGIVIYRRRKTGQLLSIQWTKEMQQILDKYPENQSDYLLPIIRNAGTNERCTYRNVGYNIKHIAQMVGIEIPLTLYVARHSWASAAKTKGIPLSVISEGLGHENEATTRIYLDTAVVNRANALILKSLK